MEPGVHGVLSLDRPVNSSQSFLFFFFFLPDSRRTFFLGCVRLFSPLLEVLVKIQSGVMREFSEMCASESLPLFPPTASSMLKLVLGNSSQLNCSYDRSVRRHFRFPPSRQFFSLFLCLGQRTSCAPAVYGVCAYPPPAFFHVAARLFLDDFV